MITHDDAREWYRENKHNIFITEHQTFSLYVISEVSILKDCRESFVADEHSELANKIGPALVYVIDCEPDANLGHDHLIGVISNGKRTEVTHQWPLSDRYTAVELEGL